MGNEKWKEIPNTDGKYSVSNCGRVRCNGFTYSSYNGVKVCEFHRKPHIMNQWENSWGYPVVYICGKNILVSRLVASAFVDNADNKPCVNHIDGNKENNCAENLEWVTVGENNNHAIKHGLRPSGERYPHSKLTDSIVREIRKIYKPKTRGCGCKSLAKKFGVCHSTIEDIISGKKWRHLDEICC